MKRLFALFTALFIASLLPAQTFLVCVYKGTCDVNKIAETMAAKEIGARASPIFAMNISTLGKSHSSKFVQNFPKFEPSSKANFDISKLIYEEVGTIANIQINNLRIPEIKSSFKSRDPSKEPEKPKYSLDLSLKIKEFQGFIEYGKAKDGYICPIISTEEIDANIPLIKFDKFIPIGGVKIASNSIKGENGETKTQSVAEFYLVKITQIEEAPKKDNP